MQVNCFGRKGRTVQMGFAALRRVTNTWSLRSSAALGSIGMRGATSMPSIRLNYLLKRSISLVAISFTLNGCSQVPDAVNPVEWYNSTVNFFSGDQENRSQMGNGSMAEDSAQAKLFKDGGSAGGEAKQGFPKLSRVDRQAEYDAARKRGGLVADVQGRQYAPAIARQQEPASQVATAPPPEPTSAIEAVRPNVGSTQSSPSAQPTIPVISSTGEALTSTTPSLSSGLPTEAEQQASELRLRKKLAEIRIRAGQQGPALPLMNAAALAMGPDQFGTVVVSSDGVQPMKDISSLSTPNLNTALTTSKNQRGILAYLARQQSPLTPNATKIATIQFSNGSSNLSAADKSILSDVQQLQRERGGKIYIVGHASRRTRTMDPVRHKMVNFNVSMARANVVARELLRLGFKKEELVVDALSDTAPLYLEFMPTGEAGNRRAEIYLRG